MNTDEQRRREHEATAPHGDENLIADLTVVKVDNGPHDIGWTYPAETNATMLESPGANAKRQRAGGGDRHVALEPSRGLGHHRRGTSGGGERMDG